MKGKTNTFSNNLDFSEKLHINLVTNQTDHSDLNGSIITVKYNDIIESCIWKGDTLLITIPAHVAYTISFDNVEGYKTPNTLNFTSEVYNNRFVTATYQTEFVTINVSAGEGEINDYEIMVSTVKTIGKDYTKLEYIESTGTQWIDTGYKPNNNTDIYMTAMPMSIASADPSGFICGSSSPDHLNGLEIYAYNSLVLCNYNGVSERSSENIQAGTKLNIAFVDNAVNITSEDGVTYLNKQFSTSEFESATTLRFCMLPRSTTYHGMVKIYSCKIYENGILVKDYIPALNSDGIAGLYEAINDIFYISEGFEDFVAGDIEKEIIAIQTTATATYKIPYSTTYTISANNIDGYNTPSLQTFIASQVSRTVLVQYIDDPGITNPDYGIYIQSTDNKFYTASTWDQVSKIPNGIAIITDRVRLVMALHNISDSMEFAAASDLPDINITAYDTVLKAQDNWSGYNNTQRIIKDAGTYVSSADYAPGACVNFTFPNGKKGYLGSTGEWYQALGNNSNYSEVTALLSKVGGTTFAKYDMFWTSTLYKNAGTGWTNFWTVYNNYGNMFFVHNKGTLDSKLKVRAFTTL